MFNTENIVPSGTEDWEELIPLGFKNSTPCVMWKILKYTFIAKCGKGFNSITYNVKCLCMP